MVELIIKLLNTVEYHYPDEKKHAARLLMDPDPADSRDKVHHRGQNKRVHTLKYYRFTQQWQHNIQELSL